MMRYSSLVCSLSLLLLLVALPLSHTYDTAVWANQGQDTLPLIANSTNYTVYKNLDSGGNDIQGSPYSGQSVQQLQALCSSNPQCAGFNTLGYLKNRIQRKDKWASASFDLYLKQQPNPVYTQFHDLNIQGNDLPGAQPDYLANMVNACNANVSCVAVNTLRQAKNLLPNTLVSSPGTFLQVKGNYTNGYFFYQGFDSGLGDLNYTGNFNVTQQRALCDASSSCAGFNTLGYLKQVVLPAAQWDFFSYDASQGLYVKWPGSQQS